MDAKEIKKKIAVMAVEELVRDDMKLGLGTGSTALEMVKHVGELVKSGRLRNILCVPTSLQTEFACHEWNIPLFSLNDPRAGGQLDLTIDGADEVDDDWYAIKGGGGALLEEKIVASYSNNYAIMIEKRKRVSNLGLNFPVPVEIIPSAYLPVSKRLLALGGSVTLRQGYRLAGPVLTRQGNLILDVLFREAFDPKAMEQTINAIPGVADNGIFTVGITDLFIGNTDGKVNHMQRKA